jgi:hydroxyethylthiazole kinase
MKINEKLSNEIYKNLEKVRNQKPLVHHITNWVTIYDCANVVKIFGASPVMAHAKEEVNDMVNIASSLVLNIGTLTTDIIESMIIAGKRANERNIPVVLDVCGAGATPFRDDMCKKILSNCKIDILKGNSSEIARIAGMNIQTKGVDSSEVNADLSQLSKSLAVKNDCTVVITGKYDIVSDKSRTFIINNGHEMMSRIVGTGCMAASVVGTFAGVSSDKDYAFSSVSGLVCYEIAAEIAANLCQGPGTFKEHLFDAVSNLSNDQIIEMQNAEVK